MIGAQPQRVRRRQRASFLQDYRDPLLASWALFIATLPFYLGASGLPQPGNAMLFVIVPLGLSGWNGKLWPGARAVLRPLIAFVAWVILVDYGWAAITNKWGAADYLLHPLYYVFNAILLFAGVLVYQRRGVRLLRVTAYTLVGMVVFQVAASAVYTSPQFRGQLFFNNPNQLGYYALLSACAIAMIQKQIGMSLATASVGLTACAYLAVLSSSRAAAAGVVILLVFLVFSNPRLIILGFVSAIALVAVGGPVSTAIDRAERRIEVEQAQGSFAEERGYERLVKYPEYMVLGAGEGDYERFTEPGRGREIHSSAATILFSYGILGAILFLVFSYHLIRGARLRTAAMLVPTFAYTIAHQGLRFAMLWVLFAVFMAVKASDKQPREVAR